MITNPYCIKCKKFYEPNMNGALLIGYFEDYLEIRLADGYQCPGCGIRMFMVNMESSAKYYYETQEIQDLKKEIEGSSAYKNDWISIRDFREFTGYRADPLNLEKDFISQGTSQERSILKKRGSGIIQN